MSGVCAIVNFDGAPVEPGMLKKMTAASKYRGPDGEAYWVEGNFGVAHQASHITPEEIYENQPSVSPHGDLVLAADARLDNRNELIRLLRAKNQVRSDLPTDVELILAAYMVWGEACPKYLVGDFAFIVWDKKQKKVFVARDPIGVRQIHYYQNGKTLAIATTVAAILAIRRDVPVMNMPLLHDTLRGNFDRWINETAYKSIYRLPPSYSLTAESGSISLNRYWVLGENNIVNYKDEREYADHYKELLFQAVQAQLRSNGKIAVMGGAGVDSGSVACCSNKLIELNGTSSLIYAYLGVFNNIPDAEEREYLRITTDYCKHIVPRLINCDDCWALREFPEDLGYPHDDVDISNVDRAMLLRLTRAARQDGCRVMLTGYWGDQVNGQAAYRIPKFIRDIPFKRLFKELPHFLSNPNLPRWQILARGFGGPNLPTKMSNRLASFIYRLPPDLSSYC